MAEACRQPDVRRLCLLSGDDGSGHVGGAALSITAAVVVALAFAVGMARLPPEVGSETRWRDAAIRFAVVLVVLLVGLLLVRPSAT